MSTTALPDSPASRPTVTLQQGRSRRLRSGHPWAFSNEIEMTAAAKQLPPGSLVMLADPASGPLGVATFNAHSLIAARLLDRDPVVAIDAGWIAARLHDAAKLRDILFAAPYYRLVHAEADRLPGLIVDRFGDVFVVQANSAGMDRLTDTIVGVLVEQFAARTVVLKNDSPARLQEGLAVEHRVAHGNLDGPVELIENGARFLADLEGGQKTGWFFDQRDNRAFAAALAKGRRVLDVYTYAGGFAVQAALAGAAHVTAVDRSEHSLALAQGAADRNGVADRFTARKAEAFAEMAVMRDRGESFGLVIVDPPAFVKSKKDLAAGAKGYRKMTTLAARLVEPGGFLLAASCSHHMPVERFAEEVREGLAAAKRNGRVLRTSGAAADHPVHPFLPESAYLKAMVLQLD